MCRRWRRRNHLRLSPADGRGTRSNYLILAPLDVCAVTQHFDNNEQRCKGNGYYMEGACLQQEFPRAMDM
jgi:hypothetical protein